MKNVLFGYCYFDGSVLCIVAVFITTDLVDILLVAAARVVLEAATTAYNYRLIGTFFVVSVGVLGNASVVGDGKALSGIERQVAYLSKLSRLHVVIPKIAHISASLSGEKYLNVREHLHRFVCTLFPSSDYSGYIKGIVRISGLWGDKDVPHSVIGVQGRCFTFGYTP